MLRWILVCAVLAGALSGCATRYVSSDNALLGWMGGFSDSRGPGELIKVEFSGNGYIKREKVATYILYRSAEVAQREGKPYFVLYANLPDAISDRRSSERKVSTVTGRAGTYVYLLLKSQPEPGALAAADVISRLKPEVAPE